MADATERITLVEVPSFTRDADALFSDKERDQLVDLLSLNPECGDLIPGTGGVRKVCVALRGRGKSGGARVIYYVFDRSVPLYLLAVYAKNERANLTIAEKQAMRTLVKALADQARSKRR